MQFSWWTFVLQGVNFLVLVWLMQRVLYRPVHDIVTRRETAINRTVAEANEVRRTAMEMKARYEAELAAIEKKRKAVLDEAHELASQHSQQVLEDAHAAVRKIEKTAEGKIEQERSHSLRMLRGDVAELAGQMAGKILADLGKAVPNNVLIERFRSELLNMAPRDRQRLDQEITSNGSTIEVVLARDVASAEQKAWRAALEDLLKHPVSVSFRADPALLGGAVLKLPHTTVSLAWSDLLEQSKDALLRGGDGAPQ